jgi:hypothetical protein
MKRTALFLGLLIFLASAPFEQADAQRFIRKLKNKTEDKVIESMFGEDDKNQDPGRSDSPANTRGSGLSAEEIDVRKNIADAETAFNDKQYSNSRSSIRKALQGVELEIGENILEGLPAEISGLPILEDDDRVTSSGIGFVGLIIERTYRKGKQDFRVTIGNDAGLFAATRMYLGSGAYATSDAEEDGYKRTEFKGSEAVIEYDDYSGYKLSVPFGQSSILVTKGVNFDTEEDFMEASNTIDIDEIMKQLGEQ